ncbi:prolipoprotein diacylglyceryl transferase [Pseudoduganella sp. OTU4001]|uniref:prolipoprotein diacylglyceryl transferase n=1 Tax=Pseudoduganella sp. OTU4001 TaxID=3043854 RepID=UPI00313B0650
MSIPVLSAGSAQLVHLFAEWGAIGVGVQLYRWQRRRTGQDGVLQAGSFPVFIGCILGAGIGNKLAFWIEWPQLWATHGGQLAAWASGQSIVGGLVGGLLGVELAKKLAGIRHSTGDLFILPLVAGTVLGRIGCLLAGLHDGTYGLPSSLPWALDFGDGIPRHPTQVYDMLFVLAWGGAILHRLPRMAHAPGLAFKFYLAGYLAWRLAVDSIKPLPYNYGAGLGGIQLICIAVLACYLPLLVAQCVRAARVKEST